MRIITSIVSFLQRVRGGGDKYPQSEEKRVESRK